MNLRIFEFCIGEEKDWIAAFTYIEAIKIHFYSTGMDITDYDCLDDIVEIHESEWEKFYVQDEDGVNTKSFLKWINESNNKSDMIASSNF